MASNPFPIPPGFGGSAPRYAGRSPSVTGTSGVLSVDWDFRPIIRLAARMAGEAANADPAIRAAHAQMATTVQEYAAEALVEAISHRGPRNIGPRQQRGTTLVDAIQDERVREVSLSGFTVGYLDRVPQVAKYWRRIEEGSDSQVGQVFHGAFLSLDGKWSAPTSNEAAQVDPKLYKFAAGPLTQEGGLTSYRNRLLEGDSTRGRTPVVHITRAIPAYNYLATGFQKWLGREGKFSGGAGSGDLSLAKNTILSTYADMFGAYGLGEFSDRWFKRFSKGPSPASPTKHFGSLG